MTVFVGSSFCANVVQDKNHPNNQLTCMLPAGNALNLVVFVLQFNGALSSGQGLVSYYQCPVRTQWFGF